MRLKVLGLKHGASLFLPSMLLCLLPAHAQVQQIDAQKSRLTVRVYKTGLFSAFAHDHEITAPISRGSAEVSDPLSVKLAVDARSLRVMDPGVSEKDRAEIQTTMLGPLVLDSERFHEIFFQSTKVEPNGSDRWIVQGNLALHGLTQPMKVEVSREGGRYTGHAIFKQTSFGIKPVSVAGGAVKVKDEIRIEFDVQLSN